MSFWDSSAIVPLCAYQENSAAARTLARKFSAKVAWREFVVEVSSAFARLERDGLIDQASRLRCERRLTHIETEFVAVDDHEQIIKLARAFRSIYGLKAMDSLQLAAAMVWCKEFTKNRDFVSADGKLLKAAEAAGFTVHDLS